MNCPICKQIIEEPEHVEEIFQSVECDCGDYKVNMWDGCLEYETIYLSNNILVKTFFGAKQTQILRISSHERDSSMDSTTLIVTIPLIKFNSKAELEDKVRIYIVFS